MSRMRARRLWTVKTGIPGGKSPESPVLSVLFPADKYTGGLMDKHGAFTFQLILQKLQLIVVLVLALHLCKVPLQLRSPVFQMKACCQVL